MCFHQLHLATDGHENPLLAKSYAKLERALPLHGHVTSPQSNLGPEGVGGGASPLDLGRDKWHDWFKMQREWMNKVEEDPENYFDDYL